MPAGRPATPQEEKETILSNVIEDYLELGIVNSCTKHGITHPTFLKWLSEFEELFLRYARARELCAYMVETDLEEINTKVEGDILSPDKARIIVDNKKWVSGKRNPKVYGNRQDITSGGEKIQPMQIVVASEEDKELLERL